MDKKLIEHLLYDCIEEEIINEIKKINDEITLFVFACNYNWDNGFRVPKKILENTKCSLSIAITLFYSAGGLDYLLYKKENKSSPSWIEFISSLYKEILERRVVRDVIKT